MLAGASFGYHLTSRYVSRKQEIAFNSKSDQIQDLVQFRFNSYLEALYGAKGLFMASKSVERDEWQAYISAIKTQNHFSGAHSFYFAERVAVDRVDAFINEVRADKTLRPGGYPNFSIFPVENQSDFYVVKFIEPYEENKSMMGFNLASGETQRNQLFKARDTGDATSLVIEDLTKETSEKVCFINVPIYRNSALLLANDDHSESIIGFVGAVLTESSILGDIAQKVAAERGLYCNISYTPVSKFDPKSPLLEGDAKAKMIRQSRFRLQIPIQVADQEWTLDFFATGEFNQSAYHKAFPLIVLLFGVVSSFLVFSLMLSLQKSQTQALSDVKDISQELSEKEAYLEKMIRQAPDPIVLLDIMGFIKDMNPAAEYISGYASKELIGRHFSQVGLLGETWLAKVVQEFALVISGQNRPPFELELQHRSGRLFSVEAHANRVDIEKQVPRVQVIFRDLTQRKVAEANVVRIKERLDLALRSAQMGIWSLNASNNTISWDSFMTGLLNKKEAAQQVPFEEFMDAVHPEDKFRVQQEVQQTLSRGNDFNLEFRVLSPDKKTEKFLTSRGHVYQDHSGRAQQMIGVCWDITDRKKLQAQLVQSQKMETIGVFSGGIAHDLNNQLTPVLGYLSLIMKDLGESHPLSPFVAEANQSAKRCTEIIQRLMNFSRSSVQKKERVSIIGLVDDFKKIVTKFLPATIQFSAKIDEPIPFIMGNENELETVLMNLCANARDAMPNGGELTLHVKKIEHMKRETDSQTDTEGAVVCITVTDNGTGMPLEISRKIFEPFFTTKDKGKGTGLGLAMVYHIIKDHSGWIDVVSEVGKGTSFHIYLPALKDARDESTSRKPVSSNTATRKWSGTILFVDDEDYMRKLGKVYLERLGFNVILAADGVEAVEVYATHKSIISVVVMDMTMPNQTGRTTIEKILAINAGAKIIAVSGFTHEGSSEDLVKAGAKDYIQKPYTLSVLEASVAKLLA